MRKVTMKDNPIGFFDSGVGGLSVLREAIAVLPKENFIYFGDSKNAPYGTRPVQEVKELTFRAVEFLVNKGVKAVVIACNTATSAAIEEVRREYRHIPVIGIEPALKPAVELKRSGKIIIMATPVTLSERKFSKLVKEYEKEAQIEPVPCPGLAELIEKGVVEGIEMHDFLLHKLEGYLSSDIASVVLGCTHYPFIKPEINKILGFEVPIIDGSVGTAKHLKTQLIKHGLNSERLESGKVEIYNSLECETALNLSYKLLEL
jgi:glutamate racemase